MTTHHVALVDVGAELQEHVERLQVALAAFVPQVTPAQFQPANWLSYGIASKADSNTNERTHLAAQIMGESSRSYSSSSGNILPFGSMPFLRCMLTWWYRPLAASSCRSSMPSSASTTPLVAHRFSQSRCPSSQVFHLAVAYKPAAHRTHPGSRAGCPRRA